MKVTPCSAAGHRSRCHRALFRRRPWLASFGLVLAATVANAQTPAQPAENPPAAEEKNESVIVLSPFTVTGAKDVGYDASSVLSGAGLRVPLNEVAAAVSVIASSG